MQTSVARFEITYTQFLDEAGRAVQGFPEELRDPATLRGLYEVMVRTRTFDKKAIALQRTGQLGTFASSLGQEAIGAGVGAAMRPEDVLLPSYRDYAAQFSRGVTMTEVLLYWGGDERGMDYQGPRRDFPICVPVASHTCHAAGVAFAMKYRGEARVAVAILGDGATSKGDFYEAINVAGVWRLPVCFVVNNNQWAISVSRRAQTAAETLAQKAIAAGIPGEQVDGNDVVAVRERVGAAIERAREGQGASLVECLSYRLGDHTTADDASRYRDPAEVEAAARRDPIERLRGYLLRSGHWSAADEEGLLARAAAEVDLAVTGYLAFPALPPESMFEHLYASLPQSLEEQRRAVAAAATDA
ncbi:MAG: pyruvate dehydrogenase (acetyl-transferring) E1 component subunit alpha [Gammaproteobacteria bacterium]